jgi:4-nitrophenyl phosphatase
LKKEMLNNIEALIIDMDGVIWKADTPIGDPAEIFFRIKERGIKFVFATNNSTRTPQQYVERLHRFGVDVEQHQVITSSQGTAHTVARRFPPGSKIYMIGEDGVRLALEQQGFEVLSGGDVAGAQAVVMGADRQITWQKAAEATLLVRSGVPFYVTNPDKTFPTPRGEVPGTGAWLAVITTATGIQPVIAGKPFPFLIELALGVLGTAKNRTLVVGDRLETDIAAGQAVGCPTALVLSGVSNREQARSWNPPVDMILDDLASLSRLL